MFTCTIRSVIGKPPVRVRLILTTLKLSLRSREKTCNVNRGQASTESVRLSDQGGTYAGFTRRSGAEKVAVYAKRRVVHPTGTDRLCPIEATMATSRKAQRPDRKDCGKIKRIGCRVKRSPIFTSESIIADLLVYLYVIVVLIQRSGSARCQIVVNKWCTGRKLRIM